MRKGQNPAKMGLPAYKPKLLGLGLLSYVPSQEGYFAHSLEVLRYQIASIHNSTKEFDLLVFDNGSCPEVQDELRKLQSEGFIHFLILSQYNIGKTGALNWILAALPNEVIGFSDGDVLFRPGWLEKSLEIVRAFPTAGLVSVQPCLFDILKSEGQAHHNFDKDPLYHLFDSFLDPVVVEEYGHGIGLETHDIEELKQKPVKVVEETTTGVRAVIGQSHMQFIMPRDVARRILPLPSNYALFRQETKTINEHIDQLGLVQLTSLETLVYHMGNQLDETARGEIRRRNLDEILRRNHEMRPEPSQPQVRPPKKRAMKALGRLVQIPFFKKTLQRLYNLLFEFFAQSK
jgi:glycosyltransferase involved in cell wall biosynthesis